MVAIFGLRSFLAYVPGLACLAMVAVCGRMLLGGRRNPEHDDEIAELRAEVERLRKERDAPKPKDSIHE